MHLKTMLSGALCAALLAVSLTGCGTGNTSSTADGDKDSSVTTTKASQTAKTPEEVYTAAQTVLTNAKGMDMGVDITIKLVADEASQDIQVKGTYKLQTVDKQTTNMATDLSMTVPGLEEPVELSLVYVDGWLYTAAMGETSKTEMTAADAADMLANTMDMSAFAELAETAALKDMEIATDDTDTVIAYTMDSNAMSEAMSSLLTSLLATEPETTSNATTDGTVTVDKDGTPKEITATTTVSMESENTAINMEIASTVTINALNDDVVITAPADGDTYTEQDLSMEE